MLICLLSFTCNFVASVRRGFLFLWVLGMGCAISSPELKAHSGAYMIPIVRRPMVVVVVIVVVNNFFSSETTFSIKAKSYVTPPWDREPKFV